MKQQLAEAPAIAPRDATMAAARSPAGVSSAVSGALARRLGPSGPATSAVTHRPDDLRMRRLRAQGLQAIVGNHATRHLVQRGLYDDLSQGAAAAAEAARLVGDVVANPSRLPLVMAAISWQAIPDALKGPIIDRILEACLAAARQAEFPPIPGPPLGPILKHVSIGFLERALSYPTGMKVRIADRMARMVLSPSADFSLGYLTGLLHGLWDGITGPFVLLWDLLKIAYEVQTAQWRLIANLIDSDARRRMGQDVQAALDRVRPAVQAALAELSAGRSNPAAIVHMLGRAMDAVVHQVEALGATLSDALLQFLNRPDRRLGEGLGWLSGTLTFEVLLLVLTEGGYTVLKESLTGLRGVVRLIQAGERAWEAMAPVRAALAGFRSFAAGNRALAPLVQALEELFSLLVRFLRFSYGISGPGGAAGRMGEHGAATAERGAVREIETAPARLRVGMEVHNVSFAAGRFRICSTCGELSQRLATALEHLPENARVRRYVVELNRDVTRAQREFADGLIDEARLEALSEEFAQRLEQMAGGDDPVFRRILSGEAGAESAYAGGEEVLTEFAEARRLGGTSPAGRVEGDTPLLEEFPSTRGPRLGRGEWSGTPRNSDWMPDSDEVLALTGHRPIPFRDGYPDLSQFIYQAESSGRVGQVIVPRTVFFSGGRRLHNRFADEAFARQVGWLTPSGAADVARVRALRRGENGWTWHHVEHDTILQLVPKRIHQAAQHAGGISTASAL